MKAGNYRNTSTTLIGITIATNRPKAAIGIIGESISARNETAVVLVVPNID